VNKFFSEKEKLFLALELGGMNLRKYYWSRVSRSNEEILTKVIKGAARALAQFHKCDYNFVLFLIYNII